MNEKFVNQYSYVVVSNYGSNFKQWDHQIKLHILNLISPFVVTKAPHVKGWGLSCFACGLYWQFLIPAFIVHNKWVGFYTEAPLLIKIMKLFKAKIICNYSI